MHNLRAGAETYRGSIHPTNVIFLFLFLRRGGRKPHEKHRGPQRSTHFWRRSGCICTAFGTPTHLPAPHCRKKSYPNFRATVSVIAGKTLSEIRLSRLGRRSSHETKKSKCKIPPNIEGRVSLNAARVLRI